MKECPACGKTDQIVNVAIHLMDAHGYAYEKAQDWIREQEEKCA